MAKKEMITRNGTQKLGINVDAPVGPVNVPRTRNLPSDVLLIQAIFNVFARRLNPAYLGLQSLDEVPTPNGVYDAKTENAILRYQTTNRSDLLRVDGIVDPGSYGNRNVIDRLGGQLMTITLFHMQLIVLFDVPDYTTELTRLVPQLAAFLK
jgi:hypothetical protein